MNELTVLKAIFLGALQGATEFLPVSSSGHLVIAQGLLGVRLENGGLLAFDVCLHFGTLLAVAAYFWRDIADILASPFAKDARAAMKSGINAGEARKLGIFVLIGTVPAGVVGVVLDDFFEALVSNPLAAAFMLLVTGAILWATRRVKGEGDGVAGFTLRQALIVGFAQAFAIIPGISRSGSTISGGLFVGMNRELAAKFAFLLAIPAIGGATVLKIGDLAAMSNDILVAALAGAAVAAAVGFACIKWLLALVRRGRICWFAPYCWAVGLATIAYVLSSSR
ncbi:MAG: undecaprenyl-diphosphate phosphatase [Proteobacteria bacterium]|nr:undecaprenyl-diphosphate phosphatase [Pseudomonadota bacterium]